MVRELRPWRRRLEKKRDHRLIPFGRALAGTFALAIGLTSAGLWIGLSLLGFRHFQAEPVLPSSTFYDLLKLVFGVVAGIGGVIALVVAYRRQRIAEGAEDREQARVFNERFITAAQQLGADNAAVRLAGVYAMAQLADDWEEQRQTCIDVLCAYLRIPYIPEPPEANAAELASWRGLREVRHTIVRVITAHLRATARISWCGYDLDFTAVVFDGGDFGEAQFTGGNVNFYRAQFTGSDVTFFRAQFTGSGVNFSDAQFTGSGVSFYGAEFTGSNVSFNMAQFTGGEVSFYEAEFTGGEVSFYGAEFTGSDVTFYGAQFTGSDVSFVDAQFTGGKIDFSEVDDWSVPPSFSWASTDASPQYVHLPPIA